MQQTMTEPEAKVYNWLEKHKVVFSFQSSEAGGIYELGGSVIDFTLDDLSIGIRVQGTYWHEGIAKQGRDLIQREMLEGLGYTVVDVWEDDLDTPERVEQTMRLAIQGEEVIR